MARPDIYQLLIDVKGLDKLAKFNQYSRQIAPAQRRAAVGIKGTGMSMRDQAKDRVRLSSFMREQGLFVAKEGKQQANLAKRYTMTGQSLDRYGKTIGATLTRQGGLEKVTLKTTRRFQDMRQIIGKVAFWAVATTAIYGTQKAMRAAAKMMEEFAVGMARVATVTRGSTEDIGKLSGVVLRYAMGSKAAIGDIATAMYLLGSAGLTVEEQTAGLKHVMDLTVGTFGNIEQVGRLVAGSYNVFGKQMKGLISTSARFKRISDILAFTYSTQQVELAEIAGAFKIVGSASSILAIDFETLVGTIGALNSGMLKGTRAGTCYDDKTEVLTKSGFKYWKDVTMEDEFATLNPDNHELEYQFPTKIIDEEYEGQMYRAVNKHLDICVTPNHWMYTKGGQANAPTKYKSIQAKDIFGRQRTYIRGAKWNGKNPKYFILPSIQRNGGKNREKEIVPEKKIPIKDYLEFMGFFLSEGNVSKYTDEKNCSSYQIKVAQNETSKYFSKIEDCLERMPYSFKYYCNHQFSAQNQQLYLYLKQFGKCYEKFIPDFIKGLSPKLLRIFIKAYNMGDGDDKNRITTSSIKMRDDLEEIALKAGYGVQHYRSKYAGQKWEWIKGSGNYTVANHDIWVISITNRTEFSFHAKRAVKFFYKNPSKIVEKWVPYSGRIYCCIVPNHIVMVRRRGKTVWCMNSLMSAFMRVARNSEQLGRAFDIAIDPSRPLDFVDVMNQLNASIGGAVITTDQFKTLMQLFGLRGARSIASIIGRFDEWKQAINVTDATFKDFAENMKNTVEFTLGGAWQKLTNFVKTKVITLFEQDWGAGKLVKNVHKVLDALAEEQRAREAINVLAEHQVLVGGTITKDLAKQVEFEKSRRKYQKEYFKELVKQPGVKPRLLRGLIAETKLWTEAADLARKKAREELSPPKLTELGTFLLESGITEYLSKINQRFKDTQQSIDRTLTPAEKFQEIIKTIATTSMRDIPAGIKEQEGALRSLAAQIPGLNKGILDRFNLTLMVLEADIELSKEAKKRAKEESEIIKKTRESLKTLAKSAKYIKMQTEGYSEAKILQEKIADAEEKIVERADIIVERLRERVRLGKATEEENKRYQAALTIIQQLHTGILDTTKRGNILAMQTLGMGKESISLRKQELALANARLQAAQSLAKWEATAADESRRMFDLLKAQTAQAQAFGRAFPDLGEEMKKFVKETPAAQKFLEQEFKMPVSIITAERPYLAARRYQAAQPAAPRVPTPMKDVVSFAPTRGMTGPSIYVTIDSEGIIARGRAAWNEEFDKNIDPAIKRIVDEMFEQHEAATSKTGR